MFFILYQALITVHRISPATMEVFSNENTSDQFPEMISPFTPCFDSFISDSEPVTEGVLTSLPPQKLRPIRCSGKTNSSSKSFEYQPCAEFDDQSGLEDVGGELCELGFVSNLRDELQEGGEAFRAGEVMMHVVTEADLDMSNFGEVEIKRRDLPAYSRFFNFLECLILHITAFDFKCLNE